MLIKVINSSNPPQLTIKRSSRLQIKNHLLYLSFHLEQTRFLMFKNQQMTKDSLETNLNIFHQVKVWRKKQIFICRHHQIEDTGLCYRIAIFYLVGLRTTLRNSWKHCLDPTKTSDFGLQLNLLMLFLQVSFKKL